MARELCYHWTWSLRSSPRALWPLVADTNRFNRDSGVPEVEERSGGRNARRLLGFSLLGVRIEWEEEPFEWVEPTRFSVVRRYVRGPLTSMHTSVELAPLDKGGTEVRYDVRVRPRNILGRLAAPIRIGWVSRRRFEATFRRYDDIAAEAIVPVAAETTPSLAPGGPERLGAGRERLRHEDLPPEAVESLVELISQGDELVVARLRPFALADLWGLDRRPVLETFLHATRAGLLELQWDLLCPLCRGPKETAATLADVESNVHCSACNIDFGANFDRSVELTFRPAAAIRPVERHDYCVGGPRLTPHIAAQQLLAPGDQRTLELELDPGRYRLRTLAGGGELAMVAADRGAAQATATRTAAGWSPGELRIATAAKLRLENETADEELFVLERLSWQEDAVTAAEVTALQSFRDLFASEVLRPGEPVAVGTLALVFTDLRDSTRFYREVGDAPAFGSVMDHLDVLRRAVAAEDGAVVKSMGDAIMAAFVRPLSALRAVLRAQEELAQPPVGKRPFLLKAGIHVGPCIAITQNGRLDYFGSTVNVAARLVSLSSGTDVVVSNAVLEDPEVAEDLAGADVRLTPFDAELKGLEGERFELFRLAARAEKLTHV